LLLRRFLIFEQVRSLKLYFLGVLLQGGGWFGDPGQYQYGYNLSTIRWCGILNRIGFAYLIVGLMEIWISENKAKTSRSLHLNIFCMHGKKWMVAFFFVALHLILTFSTYVPSWQSEWGHNATSNPDVRSVLLEEPFLIKCDVSF
jgi:heparan-alpha-glucosaminide N-acetyltransferase